MLRDRLRVLFRSLSRPGGRGLLRDGYGLARRRPRLTFGVAAATLATVAGVTASLLLAGSAPPAGAAGSRDASSQTVFPAGQAGAASAAGHQKAGRPAGRAATPAQHEAKAVQGPAKPQSPVQPRPGHSYLIYDSVTPSAIPAHHDVATYANGRYAASPAQMAKRGPVVWIDTNGSDPSASVLDVEPGDATPSGAAHWVSQKLKHEPNGAACIYTMRSEWPAVKAAVNTLPPSIKCHVHYWIADPTGHPHLVPGSEATQWYWGSHYDISTASPGFSGRSDLDAASRPGPAERRAPARQREAVRGPYRYGGRGEIPFDRGHVRPA